VFIGTEKAIASVGQFVIFGAVFRYKVNCDAVISVFIDYSYYCEVNLVHFKLRLVLKLLAQLTFPLCAGDRIKAPVLEALQPFVPERCLYSVELRHCSNVYAVESFCPIKSWHIVTSLKKRLSY